MLGYIRVSTDAQSDDGVSLDAQRTRLVAYAEAMQLELVAIVEEVASAKSIDARPGLRGALDRIKRGEAGGLLVTKLDRLTRSVRDLGALLEGEFRERVALLSVGDNIDTRTASGRLVLHVLVSVAQWEREAIAERTKEALRELRAQGVRLGQPSLGMRRNPDKRDGRGHIVYELVPGELAVLRLIMQLRGEGKNLSAVARELNERSIATRGGCRWTAKQISRAEHGAPGVFAFEREVLASSRSARLAAAQSDMFNPARFAR